MVIIKNLLPVIAITCAFFLFTACENNTQSGDTQSGDTQDSTTSNTPEKYAQYLNKVTSETDKAKLKKILTLLDSKNLNICEVDKELLSISSQARREGGAKHGIASDKGTELARKLEKERKAKYWEDKGLKGADSLSLQIGVFSMGICN